MDFQRMWFLLKDKLNGKNSWGKNELKGLMEEIEIGANKNYFGFYVDGIGISPEADIDDIANKLSEKIRKDKIVSREVF